MQIRDVIRHLGGLAATHELYEAGFDRSHIAAELARRRIIRVRQGWYAESGRHDTLIRAARVGGRATCATALDLLGYWIPDDPVLHVAVAADRTQLRNSRDKARRLATDPSRPRVHWNDHPGGNRLIVDAVAALGHYMRCASPELVGATADSIAHRSPHLGPRIAGLARAAPHRFGVVLAAVDGATESGTEFLLRWRLRRYRLPIRPQVPIAGVGRVDFLVGERLVIEVDSEKYHTDTEAFESDRRRDAELGRRGYRSLRFSYRQVMGSWHAVEEAVLAAVARGDTW